ncbi:MAG: A/G-specific adenine glycosylase [Dehalococcoidia bacterium]
MTLRTAEMRRVQRALLDWHRREGQRAPWRESRDPYHALLAAVMAQQTQMSRVLPSYERFLAAFPTIEALARASRAEVVRAWAGMGYNRRAVRLHEAARIIAREEWPRTAGALARIGGIGPFTAAIVASFAFGEAAAAVDTNVRRVLGRLAGDESLRGRALQSLAGAWLPADGPARWNQALMDYGAAVCTPRPRCDACAVVRWCASKERYAGGGPAVAEEQAVYRVRPAKKEAPFEGSARYYRGRIIEVLRGLPPGASVRLVALPSLIADGRPAPPPERTRELVRALEREGLASVRRSRVSLPE